MSTRVALFLAFAFIFYVSEGTKVTFTNRCPYTVWPATLTNGENVQQLSTTGFELANGASNSVDLPSPWSGRFWARTECSNGNGGFSCATGDCGSGQVGCNGKSGIPPATLVEITVTQNGAEGQHDFYDVSNVDGFNVRVSVTPQGGTGDCKTSSCPADINANCPAELQVKRNSDGEVIACKSACLAFNQDQYCCRGNYDKPDTCPPTNYSQFFSQNCPDAYSYAYDDKRGTFTCSPTTPQYDITFCP
ncbi:hypothetical protein VNO77_16085 [Canavalia gladiata]|uniref:Thaumatin-like protein n=1 Tax=Canavalia gladiata TaxID=3824 RepID=A0AAN9M0C9_CANGL